MPRTRAPQPSLKHLISLPELADQIGRSRETVWRWVTRGRQRLDGRRIRLRSVRVGTDRLLTSRHWFREFVTTLRAPLRAPA